MTLEPLERVRKLAIKKVKEDKPKDEEKKVPFKIVAPWEQDEKLWELPLEVEPLVNVMTFGWTEDGRCGYPPPDPSHIQVHPRPVHDLREPVDPQTGEQYVVRMASAGSKHSLFIMMNCREEVGKPKYKKHKKKIVLAGLNQTALCEERGFTTPRELIWDEDEEPVQAFAGNGNSFVLTRLGNLFSFGQGRYGVLGHCEERSSQVPRQILTLKHAHITQVALGLWHVLVLCDDMRMYSWGRNNVGQLGRRTESLMELIPEEIAFFKGTKDNGETVQNIACGSYHSMALVSMRMRKGKPEERRLYMWGDNSRGQCGNALEELRSTPQENSLLSSFISKKKLLIRSVVAGGYHNLAVTEPAGQVVAWGASDYGQLGLGSQFDEAIPQIIPGVQNVIRVAAGARHSMALCDTHLPDMDGDGISRNFGTSAFDLYSWGYNGYGELGLSDTNLRMFPTRISAFNNARILDISCGDRHSIVVTCPKPMINRENHKLRPYYSIIDENNSEMARGALKIVMKKKDLDPTLLDLPHALLPDQPGEYDDELKNSFFEKGLRYCMDSTRDPSDWRRASLECAFECVTTTHPPRHLKNVCLACARHCQANTRLLPYARRRTKKDYRCDCRTSGLCVCTYSHIRGAFDDIAGEDFKIGPNQLRNLVATLRNPEPVEKENMDDCLAYFATSPALARAAEIIAKQKADVSGGVRDEDDDDSDDDAAYDALEGLSEPRIGPLQFEKWFREYFDVVDSDSQDEEDVDKW